MARNHKPAVRRYHDRVARRYDDMYQDAYWQVHDALTWDYIKPHLPSNQSLPILDLGCGTGKWALKLLKSGFAVTCVDIAGNMVEQARRRIESANLAARASFCQADLCDLSQLPAKSFGLAVALGEPLGCTDSPPRALKQIRDRLIVGGVLIATLDNRLAALDYYMQRGDAQAARTFWKNGRTHWLTRDSDERFEIHTYTPAQAVKLFESAGFSVVELIGKTVLPFRLHRDRLEDFESIRGWTRLEKALARDRDAVARAAHLQITARASG